MRLILIFLALFHVSLIFSQETIRVTGKIIDSATGEELIGVTVIEKGTTNGSITDFDGNFTLNVRAGVKLVISYIGYKTVETEAIPSMMIKLETDSKLVDEVVVVGYSVVKKRDVLGAVGKMDDKEITQIPVSNAQQAIQGRVSGVNVSNQTGAPGAPVSVRIRGIGSISSSNEPLYIIDGIPVERGLSNISPNDIDNISILKDASYAAIYGSRANNGVVLITTKKGKEGEAKITYNGQFGWQTPRRLTPMTNTQQYIELYNEAARADNAGGGLQRALIEGNFLKDFADVNYLDEIFRAAPMQTHELSFSGGSETTQYLISLTFFDQEGIIKNTNFDRFNIRSNINSQVKKWLQVGLNMNASSSSNRRVSSSGDGFAGEGGSVIRYAFFRNPAIPVYNSEKEFLDLPSEYYGDPVYNSFFGDGYNPVGLIKNTDMTEKIKSIMISGNLMIKLPANFFIKSVIGTDYEAAFSRTFNPTWGTNNRINSMNSLNVYETKVMNTIANATINHSFQLSENNNFNWFIGTEAIRESAEQSGASENDYSDLIYLGKGKSKKNPYQSEWGSSLLSFFMTLNYNYKQKYYLTALVREDGSSRFAKENRWGTFYSIMGGWNIESEDFMMSYTNINKLKLTVGYGAIGNQNIGYYATLDRYNDQRYYTFGGNSYNGYVLTRLGNTDLKWETSNQLNAGIDLELWRNTVGISLDYYHKVNKGMLVEASYPPSTGNAATPWINNGSVLNTGVDLELFYRKNFKKGSYEIRLNGGYLYNEVLSLDAPLESGRVDTGVNATRTEVGYPIGSFFLYEMDGIFQNDIDIMLSAYQGRNIQPGDVKYKDQNLDNVIDSKDRVHVGSSIPKFNTGLSFAGNLGQWDMNLFFQGAFGHKIYMQINHDIEGFYRGFNVTKRYYDGRWTGEGTSNEHPRASWSGKQNNARAGTTRFLEDGSYFRMKNIQLGYTIPNTGKIKVDTFRMFLSATNLLTLTKYPGLDPEMTVSTNSRGEGDRANGIDWGTYPISICYTFGLNIIF